MRRLFAVSLTVLLVMLLLPVQVFAAPSPKVDLCHITGDGSYRSINVAESAVEAHLAHGDLLVGGAVTGDCDVLPVPDVSLRIELRGSLGNTTADAGGLTYDLMGTIFTDPSLVYPEDYWGIYELWLPGQIFQSLLVIENLGDVTTGTLTTISTGYELNLDGSRGASLVSPPITNAVAVPAPGSYAVIPVEFILPSDAKGLDVFDVELYLGDPADGLLLAQESAVFCPPEVN